MKINHPKRPTPGKPPLVEGELAVRVNVTLTAEQREKLRQLGGSAWVRRMIDNEEIK